MLASDILCIIFLFAAMLIAIGMLGALIDYWWNHRVAIPAYVAFGIALVVLIAIFISAIISIVVVF